MKESSLHPVLDLQPLDTTEVFGVARYNDEFFFKSCRCDKSIHVANLQSLAFQLPTYLTILTKINVSIITTYLRYEPNNT